MDVEPLQITGQRADDLDARKRNKLHKMIHDDLGFAVCDENIGCATPGKDRFRFHLVGDSKAIEHLDKMAPDALPVAGLP